MKYPHLIILYGRFGDKPHWKQQRNIDGGATCGYRHYAKKFGEIIYLTPQETNETWDESTNRPYALEMYLKNKPDSIIWSVKHDPTGQKDEILKRLPNKTVFYSCCSYNVINRSCDISLCDTPGRVKDNGVLWVKGKDPDYWKPSGKAKEYDYILIGSRGDKNEVWFINQLIEKIKEPRRILWVGNQKNWDKIRKSHHYICCTPFSPMEQVRDHIDTAKVGIILSEIKAEGFPQTFLEMTMMGVPVVYMGPGNDKYFNRYNSVVMPNKFYAVEMAEKLLTAIDHTKCRQYAIDNYSLEESYRSILGGLNVS